MDKEIEVLKQLIYKVSLDMLQNNGEIGQQGEYQIKQYIENNL